MSKIFRLLVAYPKSVLALVLALFVVLGFYSSKLEIDASSQTLLLENDKDFQIAKEVDKRYQTPNFLVVAYTPKDDILAPNTLNLITNLSADLEKFDFVKSVLNITNVPLLENKDGSLSQKAKDISNLKSKDVDINAARKEFLTSPLYSSNLVSKDLKTTAIVINLKPNLKYDEFIQKRENLTKKKANSTISEAEKNELSRLDKEFKIFRDKNRIKEHNDITQIRELLQTYRVKSGEKLFLGGINMIADDMVNFVKNDVVTYGAASLVMLILCLWLFFRQIRFVVLPILICVISAVYASGLFGLLGYEVTVISSNYVALQIIITVSVAIHLVVGYRERSLKYPSMSQKQLVYMTLKDRLTPCFFAIFTTVIGFFSLVLSDIKPIIMLGIMMSVGISVSLLVAFVVFGSVMALLKKIPVKSSFEDSFKFTLWCAKLAINRRGVIYAFSLAVLLAGVYGISKIKVENSFIGYFKDSTEIHAGMVVIDKELGGTIPFDVVIKFKDSKNDFVSSGDDVIDSFEMEFEEAKNDEQYWFSSQKMRVIQKVHDFLKEREFVGNVGSLATLLEIGKRMNNGVALDDFMLSVIYNELPKEYKDLILTPYVSIEHNEAHFSVRTVDSDDRLRRNEFLISLKKELNELLKDDDVEVQVSGIMVLYNNMLQNLLSSQVDTLGFVLISLFAVFVLLFRSVKFALIALIVNLIPLSFVFGIMGFFGIPLDIMSITIAAISIGIGVDDVIHYIYRYKIERKHLGVKEAVLASHASIGYAMYYTSFAIFLGFSVMSVSNFWPTIYFGLLVDMVMAFMLIGALILLPAMIISWFKGK
ncbi:efflux RND transporter permease subunit [Campylobacter geochelonis]|uniref:efflux RND transporter permease subunit n=1 Tax=Campylobacter geochelonis TaxID=1780362 RepID=UPI0007708BA8|nr:MMPL family transporter [Campylobacter geochelonis]CZE49925.1 putative integral membrane protein [Campylobacter geochelonis]